MLKASLLSTSEYHFHMILTKSRNKVDDHKRGQTPRLYYKKWAAILSFFLYSNIESFSDIYSIYYLLNGDFIWNNSQRQSQWRMENCSQHHYLSILH